MVWNKNIKAVFDVVPALSRDGLGVQDREIKPEIDLKNNQTTGKNSLDDLISEITSGNLQIDVRQEMEAVMSRTDNPVVELASVGAEFVNSKKAGKPRRRPILARSDSNEEFYQNVVNRIREPIAPRLAVTASSYKAGPSLLNLAKPDVVKKVVDEVDGEIEVKPQPFESQSSEEKVRSFYKSISLPKLDTKPKLNTKPKLLNFHISSGSKKRRTGLWLAILVIAGIFAYGLTLKNELVREGTLGLENLEEARRNLENFNFLEAAESFDKSYQRFSQASQNLNLIGAGLAGIFSDLPGFDTLTIGGVDKLKSAKDIIEAGKLIARSGQTMSEALGFLSKTGSVLNPNDRDKVKPSKVISQLKNALIISSKNLKQAKALLASVDETVLPEEKRSNLIDFKDKIPLFEKSVDTAVEYTDFLESIVGIDRPKKYLLLFNNYSELRPIGGFPGTYGVVSFSGGGLVDFFVDDVYNLDGQLKKNIIPPRQLQHITPTWGMRDAGWFVDFPSSAKKIMSFFLSEAGYNVDGVIALNPDVVSGILSIIGPVEMPEYGITLTADNFLAGIQEEVEYGENRDQPKKVVVDFAPRFLGKLYSADSEKWMKIFNVLIASLEEKDILFYFNEKELENFAIKEGFGGEVKKTPAGEQADYLAINFSNIKGSKTDAVIDSSIVIDNTFETNRMFHKVNITRSHRGGDHEHGFYNRSNPSYVRVLTPEEAELIKISGNDIPDLRPLINYSLQGDFERDRDLVSFESGFYPDDFPGVERFSESGKKGLAFWMITEPNTTKTVEFEYAVPFSGNDYGFYFQKQPGLDWKNFQFVVHEPEGEEIAGFSPLFSNIGDIYMLDSELKKDLEIKIDFE